MEHTTPDPAIFSHVRVVIGMVVSLSLARILTGVALFIQHPGKMKVYPVHLAWAGFLLIFLLHFWWWEFRLQALTTIGFGVYLFLISYCCLFFMLAVLLFPTTLDDYAGYEDYFYSRRKWFFGVLALVFAVDLLDTALKGKAYFGSFGYEYPIRNITFIALCLIAAGTRSRTFHTAFVSLGIIYQLSWIFRAFDVLE
ncbi:MAG TPA: hypothetical protein VGN93_15540 [Shinella sp.]|jgi:hypothetical protein|uniref:hypothetical protein n=1 Tax=Shinella sp. TaxID=1870904 RepID=UPI002E0DE708|nr:hypothetical protein [Shinella sp.]